MFFGGNNGILGAPMEQQGVSELQGYERRMNPGQGRVLSSNPMSYGQPGFQLTPGTNPFNPGQPAPGGMTPPVSGEPVNAPLPTGAGGMVVPAGATPPFNPGESGVPASTPAPDTGDPIVDGMIQQGMMPTSIPLKEEMNLGQRMSALGMVLSAAGTPQFGQVAGAVNAGIMQRTQGIEKYNRDLMALTKPRTVQKEMNNQLFEATIQPAYKYNPETNSIDELPPSPSPEWKRVLDARDQAERTTTELSDGITYYTDSLGGESGPEPVDQGQLDAYKRGQGRGGITAFDAAKELGKEGEMLKSMLPNYMTLDKTLGNEDNPFADVATLFAFMKTADPGSVVRPSEGEMFSSAGSLSTELANALNGLKTGKTLTKKQQQQLRVVVDDIMIGHIDRTEQARANWEEFFGQDAQVADGWDTQILNPYDALYGSEIPSQVRGRIANRGTVAEVPEELEALADEIINARSNTFHNRAGR